MAALVITAASVQFVSGTILQDQIAGEAFIAGACVYYSASGTWLKAQCDGSAVEAGANNLGMALATADAANARVSIATDESIVAIGTGTAGINYVVGAVAGTYVPDVDLVGTNKCTPAAIGIGTSQVKLKRNYNAGSVR